MTTLHMLTLDWLRLGSYFSKPLAELLLVDQTDHLTFFSPTCLIREAGTSLVLVENQQDDSGRAQYRFRSLAGAISVPNTTHGNVGTWRGCG